MAEKENYSTFIVIL